MKDQPIARPQDLVGEELSAVCFVRDYVEFHFDGPILRSISDPTVVAHGRELQFPAAGFRDAVCEAIGAVVDAVDVEDGTALTMTLNNGVYVRIPLDAESQVLGESMHFVPRLDGPMQVW